MTMNSLPKMPAIKCKEQNQIGEPFNWNEIDIFLRYNSPVYAISNQISNKLCLEEVYRLRLAVAFLAQ
jgi:hypothetical protein